MKVKPVVVDNKNESSKKPMGRTARRRPKWRDTKRRRGAHVRGAQPAGVARALAAESAGGSERT